VAFFLTGVRWVAPGEAAIVYRFGRVVGTVREGRCFAWPFPVGRIETVSLRKQELPIKDFWIAETPEDLTKPWSKRRPESNGLRPGWDGSLLTGDGNLIHLDLKCSYQVDARPASGLATDPLVHYRLNVSESDLVDQPGTRRFLQDVLCRHVIAAAGGQTAEQIRLGQAAFSRAVQRAAQQNLDELQSGILIDTITIVDFKYPLRVWPDFEQATTARQEAQKRINDAIAAAEDTLIRAAGDNYAMLVRKPEAVIESSGNGRKTTTETADDAADEAGPADLIGQYADALDVGRDDEAAALLATIEDVLVSGQITGEVRPIIAGAETAVTVMLDALDGRVNRYEGLKAEFEARPDFVIDRLWAATRDDVLGKVTVEKYYVTGDRKLILRIDRDPEAARRLQRALLDKGDE